MDPNISNSQVKFSILHCIRMVLSSYEFGDSLFKIFQKVFKVRKLQNQNQMRGTILLKTGRNFSILKFCTKWFPRRMKGWKEELGANIVATFPRWNIAVAFSKNIVWSIMHRNLF